MKLPKELEAQIMQLVEEGRATITEAKPIEADTPIIVDDTPKPSKYRNRKVEINGVKFDSEKEYLRWLQLVGMQARGEISDLQRQVRFAIKHNEEPICTYIADFVYMRDGVQVVEDVKSEFTSQLPMFRLKKKLMKELHGIEIQEVI
jgi:hypothetical protein